jgi:hypothetical protein
MNKHWLDTTLKVRLPIIILVALIAYTLTFYISAPERTNVGYQPEQPIPFSHKLHSGEMKIDCRYCHIGVDKGRHAMVPSVNTCMNCHSRVKTGSPHIQKLTKYYKSETPIPWKRIFRNPDYVYFDHSVHIAKGFDCFQCHGDIASMEVVKMEKRITMGRCINCHRGEHEEQNGITDEDKGPMNCSSCHR